MRELGPDGISELVSSMDKPDEDARMQVINALISIIRPGTREGHDYVTLPAIGGLPTDRREMVPILYLALEDERELVRQGAAEVLENIPPKIKAYGMIKMLDDKDPQIRIKIIGAVAALGPDAAVVLQELKIIAKDDIDESVRRAATNAVEEIDKARSPG